MHNHVRTAVKGSKRGACSRLQVGRKKKEEKKGQAERGSSLHLVTSAQSSPPLYSFHFLHSSSLLSHPSSISCRVFLLFFSFSSLLASPCLLLPCRCSRLHYTSPPFPHLISRLFLLILIIYLTLFFVVFSLFFSRLPPSYLLPTFSSSLSTSTSNMRSSSSSSSSSRNSRRDGCAPVCAKHSFVHHFFWLLQPVFCQAEVEAIPHCLCIARVLAEL
mmetsp:Transcript_6755/g.16987  ORF Transcript_6755/g.16987 Transcript_6755/m.16987 type:complete len:217 (+) Transcript_6755:129-779(+)